MSLQQLPVVDLENKQHQRRVREVLNAILGGKWNPAIFGERVLIGNAPIETITGEQPSLQISDEDAFVLMARYSAGAGGPNLNIVHSRHATVGSHTILQDGDELGAISFGGSNGSAFEYNKARIIAFVDGTPGGSSDFPTRLGFYTTPDGSSTVVEGMRLTSGGSLLGADGTVANPFWSFIADPDTGVARITTNVLGLIANGVDRLHVANGATGFVNLFGTTFTTHFFYGANEDTYIRPGTVAGVVYLDQGAGVQIGPCGAGAVPFLSMVGSGAASGFSTNLGFAGGFRALLSSTNHMRVETTRANGSVSLNAPTGGSIDLMINGTSVATLNASPTTGAQTATFSATNKPGSGTAGPTNWLPVVFGGTTYYIPMFGA